MRQRPQINSIKISAGLAFFSFSLVWSQELVWVHAVRCYSILPNRQLDRDTYHCSFRRRIIAIMAVFVYEIKSKRDVIHHSLFVNNRNFLVSILGILVQEINFYAVPTIYLLSKWSSSGTTIIFSWLGSNLSYLSAPPSYPPRLCSPMLGKAEGWDGRRSSYTALDK